MTKKQPGFPKENQIEFGVRILGAGGIARELKAELDHMPGLANAKLVDSREADPDDVWSLSFIGIADTATKKKVDAKFKKARWGRHRQNSSISDYDHGPMSDGVVIMRGVNITVNVKIGRHVLVNLNCTIGHDAVIGDYCTINPGANISGNVTIGEGCLIGTGATIIEKITIAPWSIIGAGAVVVSDITEPGTYVGVPAKRIK